MKRVQVEVFLEVHDDCSLMEAVLRAGIKAKQFSHDMKGAQQSPLQMTGEGAVVNAQWLPTTTENDG